MEKIADKDMQNFAIALTRTTMADMAEQAGRIDLAERYNEEADAALSQIEGVQ